MDQLKVYVPQDGVYGLEPQDGGCPVEEETCYLKSDVDALIKNKDEKIRILNQYLWNARAEICHRLDVDEYLRKHINSCYNEEYLTFDDAFVGMCIKMSKCESICRAMADKFKE